MYLWVATDGSNDNSCTSASKPCGTIQGAVDKVPFGTRGVINVLPGRYDGAINIVGYLHNFIGIFGPHNSEDRCDDPSQVTITASDDVAVWAQDHATVILGCFTVTAARVGFQARQFTILDFRDISFGEVSTAVSVTDLSIASCTRPISLNASGASFASAVGSQLNIGCDVAIAADLSFTAFFHAAKRSVIDTAHATFSVAGKGVVGGQKWILINSEIGPNCAVPGTGVTQLNNSVAPAGC